MTQIYSIPERESDPYALPDVEVFYVSKSEAKENATNDIGDEEISPMVEPGWYYWYCFPGCLPDSDPIGPFDTEQDAINDAQHDTGF